MLGRVRFEGEPKHPALLGLGVGDQAGEALDDGVEASQGISPSPSRRAPGPLTAAFTDRSW